LLLAVATVTEAALSEDTPALIEVFVRGRARSSSTDPLNPEARCGRDFGGKLCSDKAVGRYGECCSKWGFCGKKPFHCVKRLGCQSECNDDLDVKLDEPGQKEENPVAVEPSPNEGAGPQVIIKTIQYAIPLCEDCKKAPPAANNTAPAPAAPKLPDNALSAVIQAATLKALGAPQKTVYTTANGERASGVPIPPEAQKGGKHHDLSGSGSAHVTESEYDIQKAYQRQVKELRALTKEAKRKAKQILKKAKKLAKKVRTAREKRAKRRRGHYRKIIVRNFTPPRKLKLILDKEDVNDPLNPRGY